jgi:hypothetical protein
MPLEVDIPSRSARALLQVKIGGEDESIAKAAECYLTQSQAAIERSVVEIAAMRLSRPDAKMRQGG